MDTFAITKIIQSLLLPPAILLLIMAIGFTVIKKYPRLGKISILMSLLMLYLLSIRIVSDRLIGFLESSFHPLQKTYVNFALGEKPTIIVVLGGGTINLSYLNMQPALSRTSMSRLIHGITLYRQINGAVLVASGGSGDPELPNVSEADAMKRVAVSLGVPDKDILVEGNSRNTIDSVRTLKNIAKDARVILVTSAAHMKRAVGMFKKIGVEVIPAPTDYKSEQKKINLYSFIPHIKYFDDSTNAIYEYLGIIWYKAQGVL
ncbi:MAG: hypothetical protein A2X87_05295 [Deltaproteobacteria bacterium GWC2_42_51]|nr:MAG: hypothetical protein A2X87_05295 [Deltaproteobacteria bacterium GWC2_42_51]OGP38540.1 MAG: hypothetical protein A2090_03605 [Deltaproteobacteria bacterium GWD2_42_10]OGP48082.1 MAG: hypothetical protein A2022_02075 [Deltaproteobacteria bacterium GWF2_42_12]OGQ24819.1 MAG: hypothetical protein A3D29_08015 [Deltaproteobacteria bacterium RIFCSPHIGHO2_02_FULL_42_44]OGQ36734.1 MAG: hypothetical protein A3H47_04470 [Deltaproteobacteria bacterium RIFCSPLOWO2_02_FULL_42_39]OGQ66807.1 MAG: hypo